MFLFTTEGDFAGLVSRHNGVPALVPADVVLAAAVRLQGEPVRSPGTLGVDVQEMTTALARATGSSRGVVVSRVEAQGPADGVLQVTDVIETIDGGAVLSQQHWLARAGRLEAGETVSLRVRRAGEVRDVRITAVSAAEPSGEAPLGLAMRRVPGVGVEVTAVALGSAAERAGLRAGDVITVAGTQRTPTAADVNRAFAQATLERPAVIAVRRGPANFVTALEPQAP
jgi:S1-C subfamily serine protease